MVRFGSKPFLEVSSKGDRRFSPHHARIEGRGNKTIFEIYECGKQGNSVKTLSWMEEESFSHDSRLFDKLWFEYLEENPELADALIEVPGISNEFGIMGESEQAEVLWRARDYYMRQRREINQRYTARESA